MRALAAPLAGALLLVACGGDDDSSSGSGSDVSLVDASTVVEVQVLDNRYDPEALEVAAGTTVRFTNGGRNEHNVLPAEGTPDAITVDVDDLTPGATAERRLTEPGQYDYYCSIHGTESAGMVATVTVTG